MIYTRMGLPVRIVAYHGKVFASYHKESLDLVRVMPTQGPVGQPLLQWAYTLKGETPREIETAIAQLAVVPLTKDETKLALKAAQ